MIKKTDCSENFYLCETICHGVGSELFFRRYLDYLSQEMGCSLVKYSFRDKRLGWNDFGSNAVFSNGSEYFRIHREDSFMVSYLRNLSLRMSCYSCPFAKIPRQSDITLGDFWGIRRSLYDKKGVSAVIINTSKGSRIFENITNIRKKSVSLNEVAKFNIRLINGEFQKPSQRADFFSSLQKDAFKILCQNFLKPDNHIRTRFSNILDNIRKRI